MFSDRMCVVGNWRKLTPQLTQQHISHGTCRIFGFSEIRFIIKPIYIFCKQNSFKNKFIIFHFASSIIGENFSFIGSNLFFSFRSQLCGQLDNTNIANIYMYHKKLDISDAHVKSLSQVMKRSSKTVYERLQSNNRITNRYTTISRTYSHIHSIIKSRRKVSTFCKRSHRLLPCLTCCAI